MAIYSLDVGRSQFTLLLKNPPMSSRLTHSVIHGLYFEKKIFHVIWTTITLISYHFFFLILSGYAFDSGTSHLLVAQLVKNLPAMRETWVWSLGWEDPLEKGRATHSSILAWRIPWILYSMGSQRVGHDWATFTLKIVMAEKNWYGHKSTFSWDSWLFWIKHHSSLRKLVPCFIVCWVMSGWTSDWLQI